MEKISSEAAPKITGHLDTPSTNSIQPGKINRFAGWIFFSDASSVKKIEVYYKDKVIGKCQYGVQRPDVFKDYKVPQAKNSGFAGEILVPQDLSSPISVVVFDDIDRRYEPFTLDFQRFMLREHVLNADVDLAELDPALLVDALYRSTYRDLDGKKSTDNSIPSLAARTIVGTGSMWSFGFEGGQGYAYLKTLCNMNLNDRVLDIGCGCGRSAVSLMGSVKNYTGFDVSRGLVNQAKSLVRDPNYKFLAFDLFSHSYNRNVASTRPELFTFPFDDGSFDLAIAMSVFTHLLPAAFENYIKQVSRVLSPNGRCFFTFFLKQNNPDNLAKGDRKWNARFDNSKLHVLKNEPKSEFFSVAYPENPDALVVYDLSYVDKVFKNNGLVPVREPVYGKWNGYLEGLWYQDILIYAKSGSQITK